MFGLEDVQFIQVKLRKISYIGTNYSGLVYTGFWFIRGLVLTGITVYIHVYYLLDRATCIYYIPLKYYIHVYSM